MKVKYVQVLSYKQNGILRKVRMLGSKVKLKAITHLAVNKKAPEKDISKEKNSQYLTRY